MFSLPPWLRYKPEFMLCLAIIINQLKMKAAKKYYDWAANYEMNDLHDHGVEGVRVLVYGTTLDTPGRRELLQMQVRVLYYALMFTKISATKFNVH